MELPAKFKFLDVSEAAAARPDKFTFPFFYDPHPWAGKAAKELMGYLEAQTDFEHNFGLNQKQDGLVIGKMFGVLVCETVHGEIGFISAVSGKLANSNHHALFVPPVYDVLHQDGFFKKEEVELNQLNAELERLEKSEKYKSILLEMKAYEQQMQTELDKLKSQIKENKRKRDEMRKHFEGNEELFHGVLEQLSQLSILEQLGLKKLKSHIRTGLQSYQDQINYYQQRMDELRLKRSTLSADIQNRIFEEYAFLNARNQTKSLRAIFQEFGLIQPPAGAGECAAPKLLHYAYQHQLKPLALAEFWWGQPPLSEVRVHQQFYPACRGKCEPILGFMLQGLQVDDNPLLENPAEDKDLGIIYEDDSIVVLNKPHEFLSVPGKQIRDSVQSRLKRKYGEELMLVHRLDMSTSGVLLAAKNSDDYKFIQRQFIQRKAKKRYVAVLEGIVKDDQGTIILPLRVDLEDRPRQLVCEKYGKHAVSKYEVISRGADKTRVYFYPVTGRTHQLRVHSAHVLGLNTPIVGDDLYGTKRDRLHLHAQLLGFTHPKTREWVEFEVEPEF
jgi:tRNA pseudouridine32 synthase / 23S rRNA pseudouridine746 synthase